MIISPTPTGPLRNRWRAEDEAVRDATTTIVADVRRDGDAALVRLAERYDGVRLASLEVPRDEWRRALDAVEPALRAAMERAARNIAAVHAACRPVGTSVSPEPGISIVRRPDPLDRVGIYAPGGRAAYPSSVLMCAVPARVAGVREIVLCSPPTASGRPSSLVLAAAEMAGVDRVFAVGGAGAIAAMAFGSASIPRVDRIVGPGNAYVTEAKLQVCGVVAIDAPAGPSELCAIVDDSADATAVATELLAQAEHDPDARILALCIGDATTERVRNAIAAQSAMIARREIVEAVLARNFALRTAGDIDDAIEIANDFAGEHVLLAIARPEDVVGRVRHSGTIFVGTASSVAFGDYMTGANHVLPTGGLARSYSGLSTSDFIRWTTIQTITPVAARALAPDVARFAEAEGLPGHAAAARIAGHQS